MASDQHIPEYIDTLLTAETFDDSAVGYGAQRTPIFKAFEAAFHQKDAIKEFLPLLFTNGSAAGKLYAALLLGHLDDGEGREALEKLLDDQTMVNYRSGSLVETRTVAEMASDQLNGIDIIIYPPSMR